MKEYKFTINGNNYNVVINEIEESTAKIEVNGMNFHVEYEKPITKSAAPTVKKVSKPAAAPATVAKPAAAPAAPAAAPAPAGGTTIPSPLPGVILDIKVNVGDAVKSGQPIMVLEAMKMENIIEATADGTVTAIKVNKGDSVLEGAPLIVLG